MYFVYVLTNEKYKYTGITTDIKKRLRDHNAGKTKSTRPYRPFKKIIELKRCTSRIEARKWEKYYKSGIGREKLKEVLSEHSSVG